MTTKALQETINNFLDKLEDDLAPYYASSGKNEDLVAELRKHREELLDIETYLTPYRYDPEVLNFARVLCQHALRRLETALHDFQNL